MYFLLTGRINIMPSKREPKSAGKTMAQLVATRKQCKSRDKKLYWSGRIDGLKGRREYVSWLKANKKK